MTADNKIGIDLNAEIINREIIPDNAYLPFVKVKAKLLEMSPGDIQVWPLKKLNSVRIMTARIQKAQGNIYRCKQNRKDKTVEVCRFS